MPVSIALNSNGVKAVLVEFDGPNQTGNQLQPIGPVVVTSDNPAVAEVQNDGVTILPKSVGTANITAIDNGNQLSASDVLTVTPALAKSASLTLQPL